MRTSITDKERGAARRVILFLQGAAILIVAGFTLGCSNPAGTGSPAPAAYTTYLYMTDTTNGRVYTYDPSVHTGSSSSFVTTNANAAGEIKFYKGIGYVAMGNGGIYYFDPSSAAPSAKLITGSAGLDAQYFAFYSATKAYVSVYNYGTPANGGVYSFNPSSPTTAVSSAVNGTNGTQFQEVIVGSDGMIYAADNTDGQVFRINPATDTKAATFNAREPGTTGLAAGTYGGQSGVFVANTGGYGSSPIGSIDFIPSSAASGTTAQLVANATTSAASIYPARLVQLSNGNLVATGYGHTYLVALSGATASVTEIKSGSSSFGSFSLAYNSSTSLVYVPATIYSGNGSSNQLYIFDASGNQQSYSPVSVMTSSDNIANVAFYQD